jgi:predicted HTH domain antitoxin
VPCRLPALRSALIAAMVGLPILAATPVAAKPTEPNENSVQATVDSFVAYLKSETNQALKMAARMARDNKDSLAAAKSYLDRQISAWRDLLSDRKARPGTLDNHAFGKDASATWQAWRQAAVSSWATIERSAHDVVDWIATWMRHLSLSHQNPETPV